ncbi:MAG: hypothetical protein ACOX52_14495 [Verrucomicrobiota bacterium]
MFANLDEPVEKKTTASTFAFFGKPISWTHQKLLLMMPMSYLQPKHLVQLEMLSLLHWLTREELVKNLRLQWMVTGI